MFIAVDSKQSAILFKCVSQKAAFDLSWMECPTEKVRVHAAAVTHDFQDYTDSQLVSLITKAGAKLPAKDSRHALLECLLAVVKSLPYNKVDDAEVSFQKKQIGPTDKQRYLYAPGEERATQAPRGYTPQPLQVVYEDGELVAATAPQKTLAAAAAGRAQRTEAGTGSNARPVTTGGSTRPASAPRSSSRPLIWEVANRMWAEAGSPKDIPVILELRKKIMNELETLGVKKTTSSTALGEWQKQILSN